MTHLLSDIDIITNETEAFFYPAVTITDINDAKSRKPFILQSGVKVIITLGARGLLWVPVEHARIVVYLREAVVKMPLGPVTL